MPQSRRPVQRGVPPEGEPAPSATVGPAMGISTVASATFEEEEGAEPARRAHPVHLSTPADAAVR